jgi:hypothetical protein
MCEEKYTKKEYIQERLEHQINWYDKKSRSCQKIYKGMKIIEMALSASIPIVIGFWPNITGAKFLVSLFGATIAVSSGIQGLYNFHERWIQYRFVCEALRHEKYLFKTRSSTYEVEEKPFGLFVERVESIISNENINWAQINKCPAPKSRF